jgi:hypothetical protein
MSGYVFVVPGCSGLSVTEILRLIAGDRMGIHLSSLWGSDFLGSAQDLCLIVRRHYQPNAAFSFAAKVLREILIP